MKLIVGERYEANLAMGGLTGSAVTAQLRVDTGATAPRGSLADPCAAQAPSSTAARPRASVAGEALTERAGGAVSG